MENFWGPLHLGTILGALAGNWDLSKNQKHPENMKFGKGDRTTKICVGIVSRSHKVL